VFRKKEPATRGGAMSCVFRQKLLAKKIALREMENKASGQGAFSQRDCHTAHQHEKIDRTDQLASLRLFKKKAKKRRGKILGYVPMKLSSEATRGEEERLLRKL